MFALGSSAYPNVCAFGRNLDYSFDLLGGQRLLDVPCGNELSGQEETFREWTIQVYQVNVIHTGFFFKFFYTDLIYFTFSVDWNK